MTPFYNDGQVTLYCADLREIDLDPGSAAVVVTSPPYNVGVAYETAEDAVPWPEYWSLAADAAGLMADALIRDGRAWVNTAVSVPETPGARAKRRIMLAHGWADALADAGLSLVDQVAWCSSRGAGTAWGSWESPASPNLRGDWESILVATAGEWERIEYEAAEHWRDTIGGWARMCSTVWNVNPARREGHPAPFPIEVARRCIRLSTWPGETVLDPFAGTGTTLLAARQLGRRAIGIEQSERYCEMAAARLAQGAFDFRGAA